MRLLVAPHGVLVGGDKRGIIPAARFCAAAVVVVKRRSAQLGRERRHRGASGGFKTAGGARLGVPAQMAMPIRLPARARASCAASCTAAADEKTERRARPSAACGGDIFARCPALDKRMAAAVAPGANAPACASGQPASGAQHAQQQLPPAVSAFWVRA